MTDQKTKSKVSITNIHYDCLERIFNFLELKDLLNVAHTCKHLQMAAAAKFNDEHGKKRISLGFNEYWQRDKFYVGRSFIHIKGTKLHLPFLRCFGAKISHLELDRSDACIEKIITAKINRYINQYCADTLTRLTFEGKHLFLVEKPFKSVEKMEIKDGHLGAQFSSFVDWYPNLRHLEMLGVTFRRDFVAVNLPHLEHLRIQMWQCSTKYIVNLLNVNRQLQSLDISMICLRTLTSSLASLLKMIHSHQSISKLKLSIDAVAQISAAELSQLAIEHPGMAELNLNQLQFTPDNAITLIGQLNSLKKFEFCVSDESQCNRIREQLNDEWKFEYRRVERFKVDPVYVIVLNRNN